MMKISGVPMADSYANSKATHPVTRTTQPTTIGNSVVALYYKDGVVIGFNASASQNGMNKHEDLQRYHLVDEHTAFAASGEYSDFQAVCNKMDEVKRNQFIFDDGHQYGPKNYGKYLSQLCYERRNKVDPFYIEGVVAGYKDGERYIGYADYFGTYLEDSSLTLGFARHLCGNIIKTKWNKDCELETALSTIEECFGALFARHCNADNSLQVIVIGKDGVRTDTKKIQINWEYNEFVNKPAVIPKI